MRTLRRQRAFTLIEMMVTVAVLAIILAMAVPSFNQAIDNARLSALTNEFVAAFNTARSEAIRSGDPVSFTAKDDDFNSGWCVRADDEDCGSDDADLLDHPALDSKLELSYADGAPQTSRFTFNRLGALVTPGAATTLVIAPKNCPAGRTLRQIEINAIGRASVRHEDC